MLNPSIPDNACNFGALRQGNPDALHYYFLRYDAPLKRYASFFRIDKWDASELVYYNMMALWKQQQTIHSEKAIHDFLRINMNQLCREFKIRR